MLTLRTVFLYLAIAAHTVTVGMCALIICIILPKKWQMKVLITSWTKPIKVYIRVIGGISYEVIGIEHIQNGKGGVVMSQHQSALEAILYQDILYPAMHVAKNSLRYIPVFGWGLTMVGTVYINRSDKREAQATIYAEGKEKVESGCWLVIYPEGTRVEEGKSQTYKLGAANAALEYGCPIYPIALNTGKFWNKKGIVKTGCTTFIIGEPISTDGKTSREITHEARLWIEAQHLD